MGDEGVLVVELGCLLRQLPWQHTTLAWISPRWATVVGPDYNQSASHAKPCGTRTPYPQKVVAEGQLTCLLSQGPYRLSFNDDALPTKYITWENLTRGAKGLACTLLVPL